MKSLDCIVFVRRQSPDWTSLADDYEAGRVIDPLRYIPPPNLPGFPSDISACIRIWNETFAVNFFRCRHILRKISERSIQSVHDSIFLAEGGLSDLPSIVTNERFLLFFFDDDDWFAPDIYRRLSELDLNQQEIAVFPLVRFGERVLTFVRKSQNAQIVVGERTDFGYRFHTNNYGIASGIALSEHLTHLQDHMLGSSYADQIDIPDRYFDIIISATNKTPCAASSMGRLTLDASAYRAAVGKFVENLETLKLPTDLAWMQGPLSETFRLFADL